MQLIWNSLTLIDNGNWVLSLQFDLPSPRFCPLIGVPPSACHSDLEQRASDQQQEIEEQRAVDLEQRDID